VRQVISTMCLLSFIRAAVFDVRIAFKGLGVFETAGSGTLFDEARVKILLFDAVRAATNIRAADEERARYRIALILGRRGLKLSLLIAQARDKPKAIFAAGPTTAHDR
jgi:hypothetical protein